MNAWRVLTAMILVTVGVGLPYLAIPYGVRVGTGAFVFGWILALIGVEFALEDGMLRSSKEAAQTESTKEKL